MATTEELEERVRSLEDAVSALARALKNARVTKNNVVDSLVVNDLTEGFPVHMHLTTGRRAERPPEIHEM